MANPRRVLFGASGGRAVSRLVPDSWEHFLLVQTLISTCVVHLDHWDRCKSEARVQCRPSAFELDLSVRVDPTQTQRGTQRKALYGASCYCLRHESTILLPSLLVLQCLYALLIVELAFRVVNLELDPYTLALLLRMVPNTSDRPPDRVSESQ